MSIVLRYTESAADDLENLKSYLSDAVNDNFAITKIREIMNQLSNQQVFPQSSPLLEDLYGIDFEFPFRKLVVSPYVVIYHLDHEILYVDRIFHEKQDFIRTLESEGFEF
ncbi:type II toxin-antitoxin system RelE/ParE family toxin [Lactococcus lactis]|uniref:Type II toxin-antitoxin system RelE/ParE family toxin n=1 Tax=Lactococcus lactis subsp. lactis A12 TaxID=1137134 RepID=S6FEP9_LACLL|nr:type II toxin-antitoxin system RelE/ParE family toxin [Lactococcus lactis]CDG03751.1 Putative uncharacterized protein [Lactococcus lactis subsp. lactis A12]SBW29596.1 Putative uncharacterized protein [Lactococcus lactis subsp. lactis]